MSDDLDVLVLGGGFAGLNTALEARKKGYNVTLVDEGGTMEYTPGVLDIINDRRSESDLTLDLEKFLAGTGIDLKVQTVESIRPDEGEVETDEEIMEYDKLVIAVGGQPVDLGMDLSSACMPYSLESVQKLKEEADPSDEAVIVGAGYVGVEAAAELQEKGLDVSVVEAETSPMPNTNLKASEKVLETFNNRDIKFLGGKKVTGVEENCIVTEETEISADHILWNIGVKCREIVSETFGCSGRGVETEPDMSLKSYDDVYAVGDASKNGRKTAHAALTQSSTAVESFNSEAEISSGEIPLMVSLGKTGMMVNENSAYKNRVFRWSKEFVRIGFMSLIRWKKLRVKYL